MMKEPISVDIVEREMTTAEFERMNIGFEEHALEFGVDEPPTIRYG
jgi:hypothetical protein